MSDNYNVRIFRNKTTWTKMTYSRLGKIKRFLLNWNNGRKFHYPICCIFRFSFEEALCDGKTYTRDQHLGRAEKRGVILISEKKRFVPCGIFHHKTHTYEQIRLLEQSRQNPGL